MRIAHYRSKKKEGRSSIRGCAHLTNPKFSEQVSDSTNYIKSYRFASIP